MGVDHWTTAMSGTSRPCNGQLRGTDRYICPGSTPVMSLLAVLATWGSEGALPSLLAPSHPTTPALPKGPSPGLVLCGCKPGPEPCPLWMHQAFPHNPYLPPWHFLGVALVPAAGRGSSAPQEHEGHMGTKRLQKGHGKRRPWRLHLTGGCGRRRRTATRVEEGSCTLHPSSLLSPPLCQCLTEGSSTQAS